MMMNNVENIAVFFWIESLLLLKEQSGPKRVVIRTVKCPAGTKNDQPGQ